MTYDLAGKRFGRLAVQCRSGSRRGQILWRCVCDCGNTYDVVSLHLRDGRATSCGCYRREATIARSTTHGATGTKDHSIWKGMIRRCHDKSNPSYPNYGARGITVCLRWRRSFAAFSLDIGPHQRGKTIDRIRNNEGYRPGNCRWATPKEQARNTRRTVILTAFGETKPLQDWIDDPRCKSTRAALPQRVRAGWSHEDAIATPLVPPSVRSAGHSHKTYKEQSCQ